MRWLAVAVSFLTSGCSFPDLKGRPIDAPVEDATPDARVPVHYRYVVDSYRIPTNNAEARMYGLDVNGDGLIDNQMGMVLSVFAGQNIDTVTAPKAAVDRGTTITLVDYATTDFGDATDSEIEVFTGINPLPTPCIDAQDTVCRRHLDGLGMFDAATVPVNPPLVGDVTNDTYLGGPGQLAMDLVLPGGGVAKFTLVGAKIQLASTSENGTTMIVAGGLTQDEVNNKIIPAIRLEAATVIARDCSNTTPPGCGCVTDSLGDTYVNLFDTTANCTITIEEVAGNTLFTSLLVPDVMIGNVMAVSFGLGATAVKATFTPP